MSDKDKKDLTRIEDLSEFLHDDSEDLSDIEAALTEDESPPDLPDEDQLSEMATDPDIQVPEGLGEEDNEPADFTALEDSEEDFSQDQSEEKEPEDEINFEQEESFQDSNEFEDQNDLDNDNNIEQADDFSAEDNFEQADDFSAEDNFEQADDFSADDNFEQADDFSGEDNFEQADDFSGEDNFEQADDFSGEDNFEQADDFSAEDNFEQADELDQKEDNSFEQDTNEKDTDFLDDQPAQSTEQENPPSTDFLAEPPSTSTEDDKGKSQTPDTKESETSFGDSKKTSLGNNDQSSQDYKNPENFKELQHFARNMSYGNMAKEGNPPFSIVLKDIKFQEDLEDIIRLLIEYKIIPEDERENAMNTLSRGSMLIPRLGEYAAISLCHKLRRFDINILMGLTEEVNPAKDYDSDDRGLATKNNVYNNKKHNWKFEEENIQAQDIIIATTPYIEGHDILEYISVATESTVLDMEDFIQNNQIEKDIKIQLENKNEATDYYPLGQNDPKEITKVSLNDVYKSLVNKCKAHALDMKGNALVGINFQITPLIVDDSITVHSRYQITCSGSVVWINKR